MVPAAILHDFGWSQLSKKGGVLIFDHSSTNNEVLGVRYKHRDIGVKIGKKILNKINYLKKLTDEILEIISQHDTRKGFISKNEGLVRDADKLWRFSKTGFKADIKRNIFTFKYLYNKINKQTTEKNFFYSDSAKKIAAEELKNRKREYKNR